VPGILVFEGDATGLGVVGDREGNALVNWNGVGGQVLFARWSAAERAWHYPTPVVLDAALVVDTYGSGHPILIGDEVDPQSTLRKTVVRRFDVQSNEWGPAQLTGLHGSAAYATSVRMDGAGNVYVFWYDVNQTRANWTWWPADAAGWVPTRFIDHVNEIVSSREAGAWLWQRMSGFSVRAFDLGAGDWGAEHELESLASVSPSSIDYLVVGPSGEALGATLRHDPTELVMSVWRYDPTFAAWQPKETALQIATDGDPSTTYGAAEPLTDFLHQDVVTVPVPLGNQFELHMNRRDPSTGTWSPLHEFARSTTPNTGKLVADDSGNLYGCLPPSGLFQYNSESELWTDAAIDGGCDFAVSRAGAFALGWTRDYELTAYRHPGGGAEWRSAQGLPSGAIAQVGSVPFAIAPLTEGHAIVVWQTRDTTRRTSIRAAFIE
jgi:hypothetical protein